VQYNSAGSLGGSANFIFDYTNNYVGIGGGTPANTLDVNGSFRVIPGNVNQPWYIDTGAPAQLKKGQNLILNADPTSAHANTVLQFNVDNSARMRITSAGYVGIATTSPAYELDVNGTIRANNVSPSDATLKENIETIPNALEKVMAIRGVAYNKIGEQRRSIGVIAQELLDIIPEVIHKDNRGIYSVEYGSIVGLLIQAIKELQQQVNELK
jgi:hypothetical protein